MIYQIHEFHGKHIAYTTIESQGNEKNGWKTVSEEEFYAPNRAQAQKINGVDEEVTGESIRDRYVKKFGKQPHHRMTDETILAQLDD